jgi:purine-binding chemotaxis protein CheW
MSQVQAQAVAAEPEQYLTFLLAQESFAIGILAIREIIEYQGVTEVPMMPACVRGVINLRGAVLPIIDLAARLDYQAADATTRHVIVVVQIADQVVGLLVDAVSDILTLNESQIQPTPAVASESARAFVCGLIALEGRMINLLRLDSVLADVRVEAA